MSAEPKRWVAVTEPVRPVFGAPPAAAYHHVNGVAALHSRLLVETVLRDFAELSPEKFSNVTNGVTPRRFLALCNPGLARLVDATVGTGWLGDLEQLSGLEAHLGDAAFRERWHGVKRANKAALSDWLHHTHGRGFDPDSLLDVQVKRIHEYKRQHLNLLHAAHLLARLRDGDTNFAPRTILLGGKAAPGYHMAKRIIRAAHALRDAIDAEPAAAGRLQLIFLPGFSVRVGQRVYPAADLSEQISTAGMEASGTGNMKFMMNGALTIGTLDGANVEIREAVGADDFFLFGLTAAEVSATKAAGWRPQEALRADPILARALSTLGQTAPDELAPLIRSLAEHDPFLVLADFAGCVAAQEAVDRRWRDPEAWTRGSIRNSATSGRFSSDRAIAEYARDIWKVEGVRVAVGG